MKKQIFAFVLCLCLLVSGCSHPELVFEETETREAEKETVTTSEKEAEGEEPNAKNCYGVPIFIRENEYQTILDAEPDEIMGRRLTWENINSFPIKSEEMSLMERRMLCVEFLQFAKTALWIPDEDYGYVKNKNGTQDKMFGGEIYGGLPYIGMGTGSVYRLMDYMDEERGVVDMSEASRHPTLFGNQCSVGAYWGWARVINSASYDWTYNMVASRGFIPVGPYTYNTAISSLKEESTAEICEKNGEQIMFQSYAKMLPADGLIAYHPTGGHVIMCSTLPHVVYNRDGSINGEESYLCITDQHQRWVEAESASGMRYQHKNYINRKFTFQKLFTAFYIPFTFGEFLGTDPVEETVCTFAHEGDEITVNQLKTTPVTANYGISDVYAYVSDAEGKVLFYRAARVTHAGETKMDLSQTVYGTTFDKYADGNHTVEVVCQLGTGERISLYKGKLVK